MQIMRHRPGEIEAMYFDKLPQRCKEMIFEYLSYSFPYRGCVDKALYFDVGSIYNEECRSPIEQIFSLAFEIMLFVKHYDLFGYVIFNSQQDIYVGSKHYVVDFAFDTDDICIEDAKDKFNVFKIVIECDGHDFHEKSKEQVKKNNQRDLDLKMAGYDVLHFSGSQLYNEPFQCADKAIDYIISKIKK